MKKFLSLLAGLLSISAFTPVNALVFTETYTYSGAGSYDANSTLVEGDYLNFGFDMDSVGGLGPTPESFSLTEDSVDAINAGPWVSGSLSIDLYSIDSEFEITSVTVVAKNTTTLEVMALDIFNWNKTSTSDPIFTANYTFDQSQLNVFDDWGWANVGIAATTTGITAFNDFSVSKVSMSTVVPEPGTLFLMGFGLLGIAISQIRKFAK